MLFPRKVYAIKHNVTNRVYVGSSCDTESRFKSHMSALKRHKHIVEDMQADYDKYGEDYSFTVLDVISSLEESHKEYDWMEKYHSYERGKGYNYKDSVFNGRTSKTKKKETGDNTVSDNCLEAKKIFANNLRKQMELKGKTRNDICQALNISYFTVSDWVNGKKYPRMDKVEKLAKFFGISKTLLIEQIAIQNPPKNEVEDLTLTPLTENEKELIGIIRNSKKPTVAMMKACAIISLFLAAEAQSEALMNSIQ